MSAEEEVWTADFPLPEILDDAGLAILPGPGYATLRLEFSTNLFGGGRPILRVESVDPAHPRRKPTNLLRAANLADVIQGGDDQHAPELLELMASALREARARHS